MFTEAFVSSQYVRYASNGLCLFFLMHTKINGVDVYLGEIFLWALDHEVVREQSQSACIGLCRLLLCMFGFSRTGSKLGLWLNTIYLLLLR